MFFYANTYIVAMKQTLFILLLTSRFLNAQQLQLPTYLQESFNGPGLPAGWTVHQIAGPLAIWAVVGTGTNPPAVPFFAPGQAKFNSYDAGSSEQARLVSQAVNLSTAVDPFLELYMYHDDEFPSIPDSVYVEISTGDSLTGPWTTLLGILRPSQVTGWSKVAVSLLAYAGNNRVFSGFRGVSRYGNNIYLDEVRIADSSFHDIQAVAIVETSLEQNTGLTENQNSRLPNLQENAPPALTISGTGSSLLSVVVKNNGTFDEPSFQIGWELDTKGQIPVSNSSPLLRNALDTISLQLPPLSTGTHTISAWTILADDSNHTNDTLRTVITVQDSSVVFFEGFDGGTFPPMGWSVVNRDGGLFDPWFRGSFTSVFVPFEGQGFGANNFQRANGTYIDDYLITPQITGAVQANTEDSMMFWARSAYNPPPFANYPDSLMILVSSNGNDTTDFTVVLDYFEVQKTGWTRKAYRLTNLIPQNADVFIAFRYLHYDGGINGTASDFVGIDAVQIQRFPPLAVSHRDVSPLEFRLEQNYPNPFNSSTTIEFSIREAGVATLDIFDILGKKVRTLVNGRLQPGNYQRIFDAKGLGGGVYFYRLQTMHTSQTNKLLFLP